MSTHDDTQDLYRDLQATDEAGDLETAIEGLVREQRQRQRRTADLETEGYVRALLKRTRQAIGDDEEEIASMLLGEARSVLENDADLRDLLANPAALADATDLSPDEAATVRAQYQRQRRMRQNGSTTPDATRELRAVAYVARGLDYFSAISDMTRYAPVTLENVDALPVAPDDPQVIGRRRIGADSSADLEERAVELPHASCDHILGVALPRRGKDSTITSIGKSLMEDHGYKYISVMDDGRMETPMLAIPNDEQAIRDNLDRFGQDPEAMAAEVFVPAMDGIPERLPANFEPFTIGIDSLTPRLILRLADVTGIDSTVEQRVRMALEETMNGSGTVNELVSRLKVYAKEMEVTIEWTELGDAGAETDSEDGSVSVEEHSTSYEMGAEKAVKKAAQRLADLAGKGLIAGSEATTNLDIVDLVSDAETAAVLCCNFLPDGQEGLKYTIMDLWLRLVYRARDKHPRLPRVVLEIRELKNIAPTNNVLGERHRDAIKTLRQTIFFLSTQGGSRRIMMLGSTQKLNDVYKPVRSNMATKILLQLGEEEVETLDRAHNFSDEMKRQLKEFSIGQGMIIAGGQAYWPIEFRGAPCGLGLGDQHWRDRYGVAYGARIREQQRAGWYPRGRDAPGRPDWWVDANTGDVYRTVEAGPPDVGEWYLLPQDVEPFLDEDSDISLPGEDGGGEEIATDGGGATVRGDVVDEALTTRRDHPVKRDLRLVPTEVDREYTTMEFDAEDRTSVEEEVIETFEIPNALRGWLDKPPEVLPRYGEAIAIVDEFDDLTSQKDITDHHSEWKRQAISHHIAPDGHLRECIRKVDGTYQLTSLGDRANQIDWKGVMQTLTDGRRSR
jgi:hypothetical protein